MRRALLIVLIVVPLLIGAGMVAWVALDLPPVRLVLKHGFPPAGGPTGRKLTIEGVTFVELGTGYFRMGSWFHCSKGDSLGRICKAFHLPWGDQPKEVGDEVPVHWVEIRTPYWIAETEVTDAQYRRFYSEHLGDDDPVRVEWPDAQGYCAWLAQRCGLPVRLPSEAEWENACRAGSTGEYCFGDDEGRLGDYAWFAVNSDAEPHAVKTKRASAWGLHDMHGNVSEWCEDAYRADYHTAPNDTAARTEIPAPGWVIRGGAWFRWEDRCRSACRYWNKPDNPDYAPGFRPAFSSPR